MKILLCCLLLCLVFVSSAVATMQELETAIIAQDYQRAMTLATEMLKSDQPINDAQEVKFYLGLSHLRLGDYREAKKIFEDLIKQPVDVQLRDRAYLGLFNSYYLNDEYKEALKVINTVYDRSPQSSFMSLIYLKMARVNLKLSNWQKAQVFLKKIINEFPDSIEAPTAKQLLEEKQYFAVQVGAFFDRDLAEDQVEDLRRKNEYAYIVETFDKENNKFYRVRVGQMTLLDDARQLESKLSQLGYPAEIYP